MHNVFESEKDLQAWFVECKEQGITELDLTGILIFSNAYQPVDSGYDHWNYGVTENRIYLPLRDLPKELFQITTLKKLRLGKRAAKLEVLPPEIGQLTHLVSLDLSNNNLSSLPAELGRLTQLTSLDLSGNKLSSLPSALQNLKALQMLDLRGNSMEGVPPEVLERIEQPDVILRSYFARGRKPLNEVKLILVGQGSVGKTSLARRILFDTYDPQQNKTNGIAISHWHVKNTSAPVSPSTIRVNLWDFGGQEIMHATHQFFLTKRSIYLIALDSRLTPEENRVEYWLKIIQSFSDASPVLIVGNKVDQHPLDVDRASLQKKYPNIIGFFETSAATGAGIEHLKSAITEQVNQMPNVRDLVLEDWLKVKAALEEWHEKTSFINQDDYIKLCIENRVLGEGNQLALLGVLHDLGIVLHFQDDPRLDSLGILNPQWVTNGVYKIINSKKLFDNHGVLTLTALNEILNLPEYPRNKRLFIIDMMKRFELCFDLEQDKTFMVPDLLPKEEVGVNYRGVLAFEYHYPILPTSVMTRFIVRMNQKIEEGFVWRTGVVLKIGDNKALVKADIEERKITIAIDGLEHTRRDALSAIRYQLDEIHDSIKGLNPEKYVPIPGAMSARPLKYEYLLKLERDGEEILKVEDGDGLRRVNIVQILNGVESEYQRKQHGNVINIGGNVSGSTIIAGNENKG